MKTEVAIDAAAEGTTAVMAAAIAPAALGFACAAVWAMAVAAPGFWAAILANAAALPDWAACLTCADCSGVRFGVCP